MSESEDLKKGVAESKARQQSEELVGYLTKLNQECFALFLWTQRADALFFGTLCASLFTSLLEVYLHTPDLMRSVAIGLFQLLEVITIGRSWMHYRAWGNKENERMGAFRVLRILGYLEKMPEDGDSIQNKRPMWERGIQAVEKWTAERKANWGKGLLPTPA